MSKEVFHPFSLSINQPHSFAKSMVLKIHVLVFLTGLVLTGATPMSLAFPSASPPSNARDLQDGPELCMADAYCSNTEFDESAVSSAD